MEGGKGLNLIDILKNSHPISKSVFFLLIACSIISIAVIIERFLVLRKARQAMQTSLGQLDSWSRNEQFDVARRHIGQADRKSSPLFSVLRAGISYWQELVNVGETRVEVMETMVAGAVSRELKLVRAMLRANLPILANISSVAPFIGLFGTVVGIILTFDSISRSGNMGQELVASGIADALIATAMGLFAAIPAVLAYNYFVEKVGHLVLEMEEIALERIYFLVQRDQAMGGDAMTRPVAQLPTTPKGTTGAVDGGAERKQYQIDRFISTMRQRNVDRAVLISDRPAVVYIGDRQSSGPVTSAALLETTVQEIVPEELRDQVAVGGFEFPYRSPHGEFDINVQREGGSLQVYIAPAGKE